MPPLEAKEACLVGVGMKCMFIDVKKAHFDVKCEEEWWVELSDEFKNLEKYAELKRSLYRR